MARLFYLGAPSRVGLPATASIAETMRATGNNTGNLLIGAAIDRQIVGVCTDWALDREFVKHNLDYIRTNFDRIVIGASNFLFSRSDKTWMADFLESVSLPCVIIGLGAQAPAYGRHVHVPAGTERMVRIISDRSRTLGVRGEFTAGVLNDMGITNLRIVGCPSMYWTCQPEWQPKRRPRRNPLAVCVNGSANVTEHAVDLEAASKVEAMIARCSFDAGYRYILQNETELMEMVIARSSAPEQPVIRALSERYGLSHLTPQSFVDFVRRNMTFYSDVDLWLKEVANYDFVLGSRFHGCLIGLLAGIPSFAFVHDARTRELCELLQMPHRDVRDVDQLDVDALYDSLDLESVQTSYRARYRNYLEFLDENGLDHRLERG